MRSVFKQQNEPMSLRCIFYCVTEYNTFHFHTVFEISPSSLASSFLDKCWRSLSATLTACNRPSKEARCKTPTPRKIHMTSEKSTIFNRSHTSNPFGWWIFQRSSRHRNPRSHDGPRSPCRQSYLPGSPGIFTASAC